MTRKEALPILAKLWTIYPNARKVLREKDRDDLLLYWCDYFDEPAEQVSAAVDVLICSSRTGFPPSIGEIKHTIRRLFPRSDILTAGEAWDLLSTAISRSASSAEAAFAYLPQALKDYAQSPAKLQRWSALSADALEQNVGRKFRDSYETSLMDLSCPTIAAISATAACRPVCRSELNLAPAPKIQGLPSDPNRASRPSRAFLARMKQRLKERDGQQTGQGPGTPPSEAGPG